MSKDLAAARALVTARALLETATPLKRNCGRLCDNACCQTDEQGQGGMLLYPGEAIFYDPLPDGFRLLADDNVVQKGVLLLCKGHCDRSTRPLACRIFPLTFGFEDGEVIVFPDPRAWPVCPLMPSGMEGLSADFVGGARLVAEILCQNPSHRAFIVSQQAYIRRFTQAPWESGERA